MGFLRQMYGQRDVEFIKAFIGGVEFFAWWQDGEEHVGQTGTNLKQVKLEIVNELAFDCDKDELLQKVEEGRL